MLKKLNLISVKEMQNRGINNEWFYVITYCSAQQDIV